MKKLMFLLVLAPSLSFGWEHPSNPDRFPSIGLSYAGSTIDGEFTTAGLKQDVETKSGLLLLDTRLPLSNKLTLELGIGSMAVKQTGDENAVFFGSENDQSGSYSKIGIRYYFSK